MPDLTTTPGAGDESIPEIPLDDAGLASLAASILGRGVSFRFTARGGSMWPFILSGDELEVEPLKGRQARLGDVAAYLQPYTGRLIVHRVIRRESEVAWLRGDARASSVDGPIRQDALLGRVLRVERGGKRIRLGLGMERIAIALLSRSERLPGLAARFLPVYRLLFKRKSG